MTMKIVNMIVIVLLVNNHDFVEYLTMLNHEATII